MDDAALRALALSIAQNRTPTDTVEAEAQKLYDWMVARGQPGEQCVIAANNKVISQDNIDGVIATATENYAFLTGGDGTPVMPWPPVVETQAPPPPPNPPVAFGMSRSELVHTITAASRGDADEANAIADAILARNTTPLRPEPRK